MLYFLFFFQVFVVAKRETRRYRQQMKTKWNIPMLMTSMMIWMNWMENRMAKMTTERIKVIKISKTNDTI